MIAVWNGMACGPLRNAGRSLLCGCIVASVAVAACLQESENVDRGEVGTLVLENIPPTPAVVTESWKRYDGARPVLFLDWLKDGSMLYATFAAQGPQVFSIAGPGGES